LRKRLRLEQLTPRQLALGAAGLFLLSVAVTLVILVSAPRRRPPEQAAAPAAEAGQAAGKAVPEPMAGRLGITDFLLEAPEPPPRPGIYLFRERLPRWTQPQVERYWIPVNEAVLRLLRRENDRRTEELLREVP
jgi:hypothetical protein